MPQYIYSFKYEAHLLDLCQLEARQLFGQQQQDNILFSDIKIDPSISPFILGRFEVMRTATDYQQLLKLIRMMNIQTDGFKVDYFSLEGDGARFEERQKMMKDVGYSIFAVPDFKQPSVVYSICTDQKQWYFGKLKRHDGDWRKHKNKPFSFSNSIDIHTGKTLVSLASKGNKAHALLDACCGAGTVLLEGAIAGFNISGCEINPRTFYHTVKNLNHYGYELDIHLSDVAELDKTYDGIIIDLPYNLYSASTDEVTQNIIQSAARMSTRVVIVSISDIEEVIASANLKVVDQCVVEKRGYSKFSRTIWLCERR